MYHFFVEPGQIQGTKICITGKDVNHIKNVLRMRIGEEVSVGNGVDGKEHIKSCDSEHLSCSLCIRAGNNGSVNVNKAAVMEEGMDCVSNLGAHSVNSGEQVGSRTQVRLLTKVLYGVTLGLQRIVGS